VRSVRAWGLQGTTCTANWDMGGSSDDAAGAVMWLDRSLQRCSWPPTIVWVTLLVRHMSHVSLDKVHWWDSTV
jgi:hypothetical protein